MAVQTTLAEIEPLHLPIQDRMREAPTARLMARMLALFLVILPIALVTIPWQQNVPGAGQVTALNPLERTQRIPAPVSGRLVNLSVQEGALVKKGQILAEMEDLDRSFTLRLQQGVEFARSARESAHLKLESIDSQLLQLKDELEYAIQKAEAEQNVARDKVRAEREKLKGLQADLDQKREDFRRKERLFEAQQKSQLDVQKAESSFELAKAAVASSEANIDRALNELEAKAADIEKIRNEKGASISKVEAERREAEQKLQDLEIKVNEAETKFQRQSTQVIVAPRDGAVVRILGAATSDLVSRGQPLIEFIPDSKELAVEFWVRGIDAPMVSIGRHARIQFEGWPAVQFAGWPSVARGTFGGVVRQVDARAGTDGRVRVLITPDPEEAEGWPEQPFLRQGVRANGWVQLETVSAGYEIWRQLNAFPPAIQAAPTPDGDTGKTTTKEKKS